MEEGRGRRGGTEPGGYLRYLGREPAANRHETQQNGAEQSSSAQQTTTHSTAGRLAPNHNPNQHTHTHTPHRTLLGLSPSFSPSHSHSLTFPSSQQPADCCVNRRRQPAALLPISLPFKHRAIPNPTQRCHP